MHRLISPLLILLVVLTQLILLIRHALSIILHDGDMIKILFNFRSTIGDDGFAMDEFNMMTDYNPADIADINVSDLLMGYGNNKT